MYKNKKKTHAYNLLYLVTQEDVGIDLVEFIFLITYC